MNNTNKNNIKFTKIPNINYLNIIYMKLNVFIKIKKEIKIKNGVSF